MVAELCSRGIWIDKGVLVAVGPALNVTKAYEHSVWQTLEQNNIHQNQQTQDQVLQEARYELNNSDIRIVSVELLGDDMTEKAAWIQGETLRVRVTWEGHTEDGKIWGGLRIDNETLNGVTGYESWEDGAFLRGGAALQGRGVFEFVLRDVRLGMGNYYVSVSLTRYGVPKTKEDILHYIDRVMKFSVRRQKMHPFSYLVEPDIQLVEIE